MDNYSDTLVHSIFPLFLPSSLVTPPLTPSCHGLCASIDLLLPIRAAAVGLLLAQLHSIIIRLCNDCDVGTSEFWWQSTTAYLSKRI